MQVEGAMDYEFSKFSLTAIKKTMKFVFTLRQRACHHPVLFTSKLTSYFCSVMLCHMRMSVLFLSKWMQVVKVMKLVIAVV